MADMVMLLALLSYVAFVLVDIFKPARKYEPVKRWRIKGLVFFVVMLGLNGGLSAVLAEALGGKTLLDSSGLGMLGGAAAGFVVYTFVGYWMHRLFHSVPFIWRWTHQMHHSAERMDIFGAFYFHPLEIVVQAIVTTAVLAILGLTPEAAGLMGAVGLIYGIFQHANINTPAWLGYVIQRPESHGVHHERGVHAYNYGDFPMWDVLFGTFKNPERHEAPAGFYPGSSNRMLDMLIGRDVGRAA